MRTILCFGDSNTYGYNPEDGSRYPSEIRWSAVLGKLLEGEAEVIEEGLVGRTTVFEDSFRPGRKGIDYLVPLLGSHGPVDELVLMLGTNDCKTIYNATADVIGLGIEQLLKKARAYAPQLNILLVSPIYLGERVYEPGFDPEFSKKSVEVSKELSIVYRRIANEYRCSFLAASDVANPSELDQEHLSPEGHLALADAIYQQLRDK